MKTRVIFLTLAAIVCLSYPLQAQKAGLQSISSEELKMHLQFLSSDELEGRDTGEPGLQIAARYLAVQAGHLGLLPLDADKDYLQPFYIREKAYDWENSHTTILLADSVTSVNRKSFYMFPAPQGDKTVIEGEVVFAGYGINDETHNYNDFENIDIKDKVVLIMNRAPMNEDGTEAQFDNDKWSGMQNFQYKMQYIYSQEPRAVLIVMDPKSGMESIEDVNPAIARYLGKSRELKPDKDVGAGPGAPAGMVLIHRSVADDLLEASGKSLEDLQLEIDQNLAPRSFLLKDTKVKIELNMSTNDLEIYNVFGVIEGSDPKLKEEMVIYTAHYDHVGTDGQGGVFNGADDNASGSVALIEVAEAFMKEKKRPKRSIGILWVSAEEIGLFGSQYFADHPLVDRKNIAAVINLDMLGRTRTEEDEKSKRRGLTIQPGDSVKVIGGLQSKVLMDLNNKSLDEMGLVGNYEYNNISDPNRYFYRSDHINFARKDIPVLFYSTGTHSDYHMLTDVEERIDYDKFLKMTRFSFKVGYNVAQYNNSIEVDNPMSGW
jgi:Zn-dependent M28 family amino/carboxypeptidase